MKKITTNQLLSKYSLYDIEKHIIFVYIANNHLSSKRSEILTSYFENFIPNQQLIYEINILGIHTLKSLENNLELLIPKEDRKLNGAFFTPDYIVNFIINKLRPKYDDTNLDPSCGCGAFLIGLVDYYKSTFNKSIKKTVIENIFGSDILLYNVERAKLLLSLYALQNNEILEKKDFNIYVQDSLRTNWKQSFNNIVGNPPYVKFQDLPEENRSYLYDNWKTIKNGTFNLYFAFFELGYKLLKPEGQLGYITPNNYFTSLAGESLRSYFHEKKCVSDIIDFNHKKVFNAQTYTAITFLNNRQNDTILYDRITNDYTPEVFLEKTNGSPNSINKLNVKKWRLLKENEHFNINSIENIGTQIGELFDICVGIATLKDDIYFVDSKNEDHSYYIKHTEKGIFKIEKEVTKSLYKISNFKNQQEVDNNTMRIIFPYELKNGKAIVISENEFIVRFPKCYNYLLSVKDILLERDKGKIKFDPFYIWGRNQGLNKAGKKLITPTFSQLPRFLIINEQESYFTNGYGIFIKNNKNLFSNEHSHLLIKEENLDVIQKILNSGIMHYYVSKTSVSIEGGYPCYQKNFIEKFSIPEFEPEEIRILRALNSDQKINEFLIDKYHLNLSIPNLFL